MRFYYPGEWGGCGMMGGFYGMVGGLVELVIWLIVILFIIRLIRRKKLLDGTIWHHSPLDILKERYAKGEINKEEYEEKKKELDK